MTVLVMSIKQVDGVQWSSSWAAVCVVQNLSSQWLTDWHDPQKCQQISTLTKDKKACMSFKFSRSCSGKKEYQFLEAAVWHLSYVPHTLQRHIYVNSDFSLTSHISICPLVTNSKQAQNTDKITYVRFLQKLVTGLSCSEWKVTV